MTSAKDRKADLIEKQKRQLKWMEQEANAILSQSAADEMAKDIAERFDASTSDQMAELLSSAIDYYVKNISVTGTLITTGSPFVHTVSITAAPTPITAGKIPNTLGIS